MCTSLHVAQFEKAGLIAHVSRIDFSPRTQSCMKKNYLIPQSKSARLEWSGFAGCFSQAQWRSVCVVWGLNGAMVSMGMIVCSCTALLWKISTSAVNFFSFKPILRPQWSKTWPNSSLHLPFQFLNTIFPAFQAPPPPTHFAAHLIQSTSV